MRKIFVSNCKYAVSPISGKPVSTDLYVLVDENDRMLWHENLFLCEMSKLVSISTLRAYACDLLSFVKMAKALGGWSAVTQKVMSAYIHGDLLQSRNYTYRTIDRHIETLKKFFNWLSKMGYCHDMNFSWSYRKSIQQTDSSAFHFSQHTLHKLYISPEMFKDILTGVKSSSSFIQSRNEIGLRLGYECGLRAHEVLKLDTSITQKTIQNAKYKNGGLWATAKIAIEGKGRKSRDIYLPPDLCEFVNNYISRYRSQLEVKQGSLLCTEKGTDLKDVKFASRLFTQVCLEIGMNRSEHQGYHRLRKSFGTNLVDDCYARKVDPWVEVPRRLGHSDINTTLSYIQFDALKNDRSEVLTSLKMREQKYAAIH